MSYSSGLGVFANLAWHTPRGSSAVGYVAAIPEGDNLSDLRRGKSSGAVVEGLK